VRKLAASKLACAFKETLEKKLMELFWKAAASCRTPKRPLDAVLLQISCITGGPGRSFFEHSIGGQPLAFGVLARLIHEASTAAADPGKSAALRSVGFLDVL
jgi:hypothetical protein